MHCLHSLPIGSHVSVLMQQESRVGLGALLSLHMNTAPLQPPRDSRNGDPAFTADEGITLFEEKKQCQP